LLSAHINGSSVSTFIWVPSFNDVSLIDENISINVCSVYPITTEILWQATARLNNFSFDYNEIK
jgi:hypothetical protein